MTSAPISTPDMTDMLNAYDEATQALSPDERNGRDIWQDVIMVSDAYDELATDEVDRGQSDRFASADGTVYSYDAQRGEWVLGL